MTHIEHVVVSSVCTRVYACQDKKKKKKKKKKRKQTGVVTDVDVTDAATAGTPKVGVGVHGWVHGWLCGRVSVGACM